MPENIKNLPRYNIVQTADNISEDILASGLERTKLYLIMGEVGNTKHYILLDFSTGITLPGMWSLKHFTLLDDE